VVKLSDEDSSFRASNACCHDNHYLSFVYIGRTLPTCNKYDWTVHVWQWYHLIMVALCNRADHYIFALWFLSSSFFSSPNLSSRTLDVYRTSTHGVAVVWIQNAGLKCAVRGSLQIQDTKKVTKNRHLSTIAELRWAISSQLRHVLTIEKKLVKQEYLIHMCLQYGELRPSSRWDPFVSLGHPRWF